MNDNFQIIGVFLIRNEDLLLAHALESVVKHCDRVIVFNHGSRDGSEKIAKEYESRYPHLEVRSIRSPEQSHQQIQEFVTTKSWIFAVDGDEIYDRERTPAFLNELRKGKYAEHFRIRGNTLHCLSANEGCFTGYLSPPSRPVVKLFNFSVITEWKDGYERLHGGNLMMKEGHSDRDIYNLHQDYTFEDSPLRCLHLPFTRRSTHDPAQFVPRQNIPDRVSKRRWIRWYYDFRSWIKLPLASYGKQRNYMVGDRVELDLETFGFDTILGDGGLR